MSPALVVKTIYNIKSGPMKQNFVTSVIAQLRGQKLDIAKFSFKHTTQLMDSIIEAR